MKICKNNEKGIINLNMISNTDKDLIARRFLPLITDYFEDKKVQKDFEKWRIRREQKKCLG